MPQAKRKQKWLCWALLPCTVLLAFLSSPPAALAHSMLQAAILLDYHAASVDAELQMPPSRLERLLHQPVTPSTLAVLDPRIEQYVLSRLQARDRSGQLWSVRMVAPLLFARVDGAPYVVARLRFTPSQAHDVDHLLLHSTVLTDEIPNQAVLVSTRSDWNSGTFANDPQLLAVLNAQETEVEVDRMPGSWTRGFRSVFHLGLRHIAKGTDHLLFLLALLLPAPLLCRAGRWGGFAGVRHGLSQILKVVTAFTVGHSVTLALAASGLVSVPSAPIEVLIAVSILISAVHAWRPLFPGREALMAGSFGLIHGLAFASTLGELGLRGWERVSSIFAFNVGIECMQLLVVLAVMPSLMLLSRTVLYPPVRTLGALFAGFAACGWIGDRALGWRVPVDPIVDGLAAHGLLLATVLFVCSLLANLPALRRPGKLQQYPLARLRS